MITNWSQIISINIHRGTANFKFISGSAANRRKERTKRHCRKSVQWHHLELLTKISNNTKYKSSLKIYAMAEVDIITEKVSKIYIFKTIFQLKNDQNYIANASQINFFVCDWIFICLLNPLLTPYLLQWLSFNRMKLEI